MSADLRKIVLLQLLWPNLGFGFKLVIAVEIDAPDISVSTPFPVDYSG